MRIFSCDVDRAVRRLKEVGAPEADRKTITFVFHALQAGDQALVEALSDWNLKDPKHADTLCTALSRCSVARIPAQLIGALMWAVHYKAVPTRFVIYLKTLFDKELLSEDAIRAWYNADFATLTDTLPAAITEAEVAALKKGAEVFINWLDESEEEEGSDDEEEDA